jgi:hypothetical protein
MNQVPYRGPTNIKCLQTEFSQLDDLEPKITDDVMLDVHGNFFSKESKKNEGAWFT